MRLAHVEPEIESTGRYPKPGRAGEGGGGNAISESYTRAHRYAGVSPAFLMSVNAATRVVCCLPFRHRHYRLRLSFRVSGKWRHGDQRPNQAQQCLLFWPISAAQELAELDV